MSRTRIQIWIQLSHVRQLDRLGQALARRLGLRGERPGAEDLAEYLLERVLADPDDLAAHLRPIWGTKEEMHEQDKDRH